LVFLSLFWFYGRVNSHDWNAWSCFGEVPFAFVVQCFGWRNTVFYFSVAGIIIAFLIWCFVRDVPPFKEVFYKKNKKNFKKISTVLKCRQTWVASIYGGLMFAPTTALGGLWGVSWMCSYYSLNRISDVNIISFLFFGWALGSPLLLLFVNNILMR
jgi:nitrate/nitrite transporter NarK